MDSSQVGLMTLAATQGIVLFTTLCPERTKLYDTQPDTTVKQNLRQGELVSTVLTLGFAGALSFYTKNKTPLMLAGATILTMIAAYEYTLHSVPTGGAS